MLIIISGYPTNNKLGTQIMKYNKNLLFLSFKNLHRYLIPINNLTLSRLNYYNPKGDEKMNILLKNVDEEKWHFLKIEAAKRKMTLGKLFNKLVEEYKHTEAEDNKSWDRLFTRVPLLTNEEAKKIHKSIDVFRHDYGFEG